MSTARPLGDRKSSVASIDTFSSTHLRQNTWVKNMLLRVLLLGHVEAAGKNVLSNFLGGVCQEGVSRRRAVGTCREIVKKEARSLQLQEGNARSRQIIISEAEMGKLKQGNHLTACGRKSETAEPCIAPRVEGN